MKSPQTKNEMRKTYINLYFTNHKVVLMRCEKYKQLLYKVNVLIALLNVTVSLFVVYLVLKYNFRKNKRNKMRTNKIIILYM